MAVHPIFALILSGNLIEVAALIQSDPGAVRARKSKDIETSSRWPVKWKASFLEWKECDSASRYIIWDNFMSRNITEY